ncbi:hypothetical protein [Streptomyces sp. NPDC048428]|uniref:hypothetical protein n=1 Tax=Streptomyces sp. NPDC048428 TaxID=3154503 RepID=UPI0034431520
MVAAPYPLPLTEHEAASAPVEALHPWCATCLRRAQKRNKEIAAELRRQQLHESQIPLFDVETAPGGGR